ncbi:MAG: macrolide export ATP-binding/permease MacB [Phycisphaeraceae bacterium]|nr:macrolide export ATP-binding/permease MacB [Phycisphaeraceae bacterium]
MHLARHIALGVKSLLRHKLRSLLTVLGVVFGVGSVVAMVSVGEGASAEAMRQIEMLGSKNIIVSSVKPQADKKIAAATHRSFTSVYGLLYDDEERIRQGCRAVVHTVGAKIMTHPMRLGDRAEDVRVVGTTPRWFELIERPLLAGRVLTRDDLDQAAAVCVLAEQPARSVLAGRPSIGQIVRIGQEAYRVVGIVATEDVEGDVQTPDRPTDAYIPLTVARQRYGDVVVQRRSGSFVREEVELHQLIAQVEDIEQVEPTAAAIESMLQKFHRKVDYEIVVPLSLLRQARRTQYLFKVVLGSIAGISLLVGGIGIMNIMLASVTERTREIGIRRAIGARRRQIIGQFLTETVVLSTSGGLIGILLGLAIPALITRLTDVPTVMTTSSVVLSLGISVAVGIVFGLYPAIRAARLDPIVALRWE